MNKLLRIQMLIVVALSMHAPSIAQNVGINTTTPAYPLTVVSPAGDGIIQKNGTVELGFYVSASEAYLQTRSNHPLYFSTNNGSPQMALLTNGNLGIGIGSPTYKLDVNGRMRIRNTAQSAGIWLDGTVNPQRSFIGTLDDNHVGMYGATSGWKFAMNVVNGNVGIGVSAPTAALDVNGSMRFRGGNFPNQPHPGAVLNSIDDNGNTEWQRPVVFKTNGMNGDLDVASGNWQKIVFKSSGLEVNAGLYYDPFTSIFNAPVKGFYHFDAAMLTWVNVMATYVRLVVVRNGSLVREYRDQRHVCLDCSDTDQFPEFYDNKGRIKYISFHINVSIPLEKNDQVWLEAVRSGYYGDDSRGGKMIIKADAKDTWFSGFLVNRL